MAGSTDENKATNALAVFNKETGLKVGFSEIIDDSWATIFRVEPDTEYSKGDFYCAILKYNPETDKNEMISDIVDIPAFKTEPETTTTTTSSTTTTTTEKPTTTTTTTRPTTTTTTTEPTTTTTSTTSTTTTSTTTLDPSEPSDVPDSELETEVPNTEL